MIGTMKWKELVFKIGDLVWVSMQAVRLEGNPKLSPKWFGPFDVMEVHRNAYRLRLPDTIRVHPVINVSFLKPYLTPTPINPPRVLKCPAVCGDEFEVDAILAHRYHGRQWQVLV